MFYFLIVLHCICLILFCLGFYFTFVSQDYMTRHDPTGIFVTIMFFGFSLFFYWVSGYVNYEDYYKIEEPEKIAFFSNSVIVEKNKRTFTILDEVYRTHPELFVLQFKYSNTYNKKDEWFIKNVEPILKGGIQ